MDLIVLILVIALIGFAVYAITTYIPMPPIFKTAIIVLTVIVMVLWLLERLGTHLPNVMR